jgi:ATP-dependent RNA helicase DeaD
LPLSTFKELGLSDEILKALDELGFETPTNIQEDAIPRLLQEDKDLIGIAQTGTGKTAAFGLPLLDRLDPDFKKTQGLILAPTRELGKQIAEQLALFSKHQERISVLPVYGGAAIFNQIKALKKTQHVIIATPGRLIDLIKRKAVDLTSLSFLILDEADEMLNMGFKDELDEILAYTPEDKLTWLFSATMPGFIKNIVKKYMDDPIEIKVDAKNEVNKNIEHLYVTVKGRDKKEALTRFLDLHGNMRGVVFCRTKRDTQELAEHLMKKNYKADALHGDLSQAQRDRVMKRFKKHDLQVLIATDVAARGIDVNDLTHVFHYTLPDDNAYYTHRSGRTARAGKEGTSIAFVGKKEKYRISRLERSLGINFEAVQIPDVEAIAEIRTRNWVMTVLDIKTKGKISLELLEEAILLFGLLSKEELIAKLLTREIESLNLGATKDLNDNSPDEDDGYRGGGRGRGRDRGRNRGGRSRDRRSGSKSSRHKGGYKKDRDKDKDKDTKERFEKGRFKKKDKDAKGKEKKKKDRGPKKARFRDKTKPKK